MILTSSLTGASLEMSVAFDADGEPKSSTSDHDSASDASATLP